MSIAGRLGGGEQPGGLLSGILLQELSGAPHLLFMAENPNNGVIDKAVGFTSQEDRLMLRAITDQRTDRSNDFEPREDDPANLVAARLRRSGYPFLRSVKCEVRDGIAVLSGTVPTFHLKQVAQELSSHTPGVRQIENRLHVTSSTYRARRSAAAG